MTSFIGSAGVVVSVQSITYEEVTYWIQERNWWVDIFNVTSVQHMNNLWELGASVAPKSLSQVGLTPNTPL